MFRDRRTKLLRPFDRTRLGFILTEGGKKRNAAAEHVADSTKETFNKIFNIFIRIHGANGDTGEGKEKRKEGRMED